MKWNTTAEEPCDVAVPRGALGRFAPERRIDLLDGAGQPVEALEVGDTLRLRAIGLAPGRAHEVTVRDAADAVHFVARLMADRNGRIRDEVL